MNSRNPTLKVDKHGRALVEYTTPAGLRRHVIVWERRTPTRQARRCGRFASRRTSPAGSLGSSGRFGAASRSCRRYDGRRLRISSRPARRRTARSASVLAAPPAAPRIRSVAPDPGRLRVHVSHWSGPLPVLEVYVNWTYGLQFQGLFGQLSYLGQPVFGFASSRGNPRDRYSRNVYIDTFNSVYGRVAARVRHPYAPANRDVLPQLRSAEPVPRGIKSGAPARCAGAALPGQCDGPGCHASSGVGRRGTAVVRRREPGTARARAKANADFDRVMASGASAAVRDRPQPAVPTSRPLPASFAR